MKKLSKDRFRRNKAPAEASPARITNDTVAEHREKVIAGGRRYKYPLQYAKHKIVINTAIISLVALVVLALLGWWQLYVVQNSSTFFYRVTQIVPLPVASVDGQQARFSDYLLNYRASEYYLSKYDDSGMTAEGAREQLQYKKRDAINIAIADAYATKIAHEKDIDVSKDDINAVLDNLRYAPNGQLSEQTSEASSERILGMSASDLRTSIGNSILRAKVAFAVDDQASGTINQAKQLVDGGASLKAATEKLNSTREKSASYGSSGAVSVSSTYGGLRASDLSQYEVGKVAGPIQTVTDDGYYLIQITKKTDEQVTFDYLHVPLTEFAAQLEALRSAGKIKTYITVKVNESVPEGQR